MKTNHTDPDLQRILALEAEGMTTSDAQAVIMAEEMGAKPMRRTPAEGKVGRDRAPCLCGCGGMPAGKKSRFLPGHDMRKRLEIVKPARKQRSDAGKPRARAGA